MSDTSDSTMDPLDDIDGWNEESLESCGFKPVPRVSIRANDLSEHIASYPITGVPLVIEGVHEHPGFQQDLFTAAWYTEHGQQGKIGGRRPTWSLT